MLKAQSLTVPLRSVFAWKIRIFIEPFAMFGKWHCMYFLGKTEEDTQILGAL